MILTVNTGSSSVRLGLFSDAGDKRKIERFDLRREAFGESLRASARSFLAGLAGAAVDGAVDAGAITAVVHRVVHGGPSVSATCGIDARVTAAIADAQALAPLHNPIALEAIAVFKAIAPGAEPIAVFDTRFFCELPEVASSYALPRELVARFQIRRYGFHGLAHRSMWQSFTELASPRGRLISFQLGSGCSVAAVVDGKAVDTSMGFSPLEGLVMAKRAGDVDPGLLLYLLGQGVSAAELDDLLNRRSGLLGLSAESGDVQPLLQSNRAEAKLALAVYVYRAKKYLGALLAVLGGTDAILFGGGVGEHSPAIRARILEGMSWCGIAIDDLANERALGERSKISRGAGAPAIWVAPVDEETLLAQEARTWLARH